MDFYSISEVADMSDKSQKTIRRQIAAGRLRAEKSEADIALQKMLTKNGLYRILILKRIIYLITLLLKKAIMKLIGLTFPINGFLTDGQIQVTETDIIL